MNYNPSEDEVIHSIEQLQEIVGLPHEAVVKKTISVIDSHIREYLEKCPLFFLATASSEGLCDVSPRGDEPGFIKVLDDKTLAFPERLGNRRIDSMHNLFANPRLGMICILPGMEEVLRINGKATIVRNPALMESMQNNNRPPLFVVKVEVEECFVHCPRALKFSKVWEAETWLPREERPSTKEMFEAHIQMNGYVIGKD